MHSSDQLYSISVQAGKQELATSSINAIQVRGCENGFFSGSVYEYVAQANIWICSDFHENNMERFALIL